TSTIPKSSPKCRRVWATRCPAWTCARWTRKNSWHRADGRTADDRRPCTAGGRREAHAGDGAGRRGGGRRPLAGAVGGGGRAHLTGRREHDAGDAAGAL